MKNELKQFEKYVSEQKIANATIELHLRHHNAFIAWCDSEKIRDKEYLKMNGILEYVRYMQSIPVKIGTQNNRLQSLELYYDFLKSEGVITVNPVKGYRIRKDIRKVVHNPFSESQLMEIYTTYENYLNTKPRSKYDNRSYDAIHLKMKLLVSLIVFQGLHTGELDKLSAQDINVENGTVYVPSTRRSNSRVIALHQCQVLPFYKYLESLPADQEKLFAIQIVSGFNEYIKILKSLIPTLRNVQHIRGSVLINWIKLHGKRKAQYMIGHRYVSSTEYYEVQDTTDLAELIEKTHLFG